MDNIAKTLTPAPAKGGTGSIGLPMDVTPQRVQATESRVLMCAFTVASRKNGSLLRAPAHLLPGGEGRFEA